MNKVFLNKKFGPNKSNDNKTSSKNSMHLVLRVHILINHCEVM